MPPAKSPGYCRLILTPDPRSAEALDATLAAHAKLLDWLDASVPPDRPADLVALHRGYYEAGRAISGLPARSVTLGFRDWVRRRRGDTVEGLPLDDKLYSIKGIETVSLATLGGRVTMPFRVTEYGQTWSDHAAARLKRTTDGFWLEITTNLVPTKETQEETMPATETALKRIGRVIAGMTNLAVDAAENASPDAVLGQAIREIDGAAEEVRTDLGQATAERHRLNARRDQLLHESDELEGRVETALDASRDDLAEAGIARQVDIEAQVNVLDRLIAEVEDRIAQLTQTLDAVAASRREAEQRQRDYQASKMRAETQDVGASAKGGAMVKVSRAEAAVARVTGVPPSDGLDGAHALAELADLTRQREVKARLERLKSNRTA
jgi:phage shock protein A